VLDLSETSIALGQSENHPPLAGVKPWRALVRPPAAFFLTRNIAVHPAAGESFFDTYRIRY
jgi:hypothetical protein